MAKTIIARYMERNKAALPTEREKLRQHLVDVALESGLKLDAKELESLLPAKPKRGDLRKEKTKKE